MRIIAAFVIMGCLPVVVNAAPTKPATTHLSAKQFAEFMVTNADDASREVRKNSGMLGLPTDAPVHVRGDSTDPGELGANGKHSDCDVVVKDEDGTLKPVCIIIGVVNFNQKSKTMKTYEFRYATDGTVERGVESDADLQDDGKPIFGSAKNVALDVSNPAVKKRAKEQLSLWINRTEKQIEKKKMEAKKTNSSGPN